MPEWEAAGVMILLFALRCLVPLTLTVAIGYLMNRQVARWEAQEAASAGEMPRPAPAGQPCWEARTCAPERRKRCPAYLSQGKPCWEARHAAEGVLPAGCPTCPVFARAAVAWGD